MNEHMIERMDKHMNETMNESISEASLREIQLFAATVCRSVRLYRGTPLFS
jgi:hypothetical protein